LERLQEEPRLNEQDEIERLLAGINIVLNRLDVLPIEGKSDAALGEVIDVSRINLRPDISSLASCVAAAPSRQDTAPA
jgi:hypothetical protein